MILNIYNFMSDNYSETVKDWSLCIISYSLNGGGAERVAVNLSNYYAAQDYKVTLLVFRGTGPYLDQVSEKVNFIDLDVRKGRYAIVRLFKVLKKIKPSVILSVVRNSNIYVGLASLFLSKSTKVIFREASTLNEVEEMHGLKSMIYKCVMRCSYFFAKAVIANSEGTKQSLIGHGIVRSDKVFVIGNPVLPENLGELRKAYVDDDWLLDDKYKIILAVGRLHPLKNQSMLIKAFSEISLLCSECRVIILGDGDEKQNLILLSKKLGVEKVVRIMPFQSNPYPYYDKAKVFVLTSYWEGFGNVLVEAMACGVPVISTNCPGGPKSILMDGAYGELVDVDDYKSLAKKIMTCIVEKDNDNMIEKAKKEANKYSVKTVAGLYEQVMRCE